MTGAGRTLRGGRAERGLQQEKWPREQKPKAVQAALANSLTGVDELGSKLCEGLLPGPQPLQRALGAHPTSPDALPVHSSDVAPPTAA